MEFRKGKRGGLISINEVDERVKHIPKVAGIFGIKLAGDVVFVGYSKDMQRGCANYLSKVNTKRKWERVKLEFGVIDKVNERMPESERMKLQLYWIERYETQRGNKRGWNRRNPVTRGIWKWEDFNKEQQTEK